MSDKPLSLEASEALARMIDDYISESTNDYQEASENAIRVLTEFNLIDSVKIIQISQAKSDIDNYFKEGDL